jgi:hypothetical protein
MPTCPAKDRPDLTCHLGRIIQKTDDGPLIYGNCCKCAKATGGKK